MFNLKHHFLLDPSVTFLNHGSFGATPKPVYREYQRWQREKEKQPVEFLGRRITQLLADSRAELGKYLGTSGNNLVYTQNVTVSLISSHVRLSWVQPMMCLPQITNTAQWIALGVSFPKSAVSHISINPSQPR